MVSDSHSHTCASHPNDSLLRKIRNRTRENERVSDCLLACLLFILLIMELKRAVGREGRPRLCAHGAGREHTADIRGAQGGRIKVRMAGDAL